MIAKKLEIENKNCPTGYEPERDLISVKKEMVEEKEELASKSERIQSLMNISQYFIDRKNITDDRVLMKLQSITEYLKDLQETVKNLGILNEKITQEISANEHEIIAKKFRSNSHHCVLKPENPKKTA
jgi:hypothetical protein